MVLNIDETEIEDTEKTKFLNFPNRIYPRDTTWLEMTDYHDNNWFNQVKIKHLYAKEYFLDNETSNLEAEEDLQTQDLQTKKLISSQLTYHFGDHLGSSSFTINELHQKILQISDYYAFGQKRTFENLDNSSLKNRKQFTGKEQDEGTNLYYFGARYYDAEIGRWTQIDPVVLYPEFWMIIDPQSLNAYTYVRNNPIALVDLDGYKWAFWESVKKVAGNIFSTISSTTTKAAESIVDFIRETSQQVIQNFTLGAVPNKKSNYSTAAQLGKAVGNSISTVMGTVETATGIAAMTGGGAGMTGGMATCPVTGGGGCAMAGVSAGVAAAGAAMAAQGSAIAAYSLSQNFGAGTTSDSPLRSNGKLTNDAFNNSRDIAGLGEDITPLRQANRLSKQYGGNPKDWFKKTTLHYYDKSGKKYQIHYYYNKKLNISKEGKIKYSDNSSIRLDW